MKLEIPIPVKVDIDDVTNLIHDLQCLQTYKLWENDDTVLVSLDSVVGVFADHIRAKKRGKDTDVPTNSALDHIHNVVRDDAYHREYEQGKADAAPKWIPFKTRPLTEEEKEEYPEWNCILDCKLPDDGQRILVNIKYKSHEAVQMDEFYTDDGCYLDSGYEIGTEATAWMPLPEPYKEGEENETD